MLRSLEQRTTILGIQRPFRAKPRFGTWRWGRFLSPFVLGPGGDSESPLQKPRRVSSSPGYRRSFMYVVHGSGGYHTLREGRAGVPSKVPALFMYLGRPKDARLHPIIIRLVTSPVTLNDAGPGHPLASHTP